MSSFLKYSRKESLGNTGSLYADLNLNPLSPDKALLEVKCDAVILPIPVLDAWG